MKIQTMADLKIENRLRAIHRKKEGAAVLAFKCPVHRYLRLTWCKDIGNILGKTAYTTAAPIEVPLFYWTQGELIAKLLIQQVEAEIWHFRKGDWFTCDADLMDALIVKLAKKRHAELIPHDVYLSQLENNYLRA